MAFDRERIMAASRAMACGAALMSPQVVAFALGVDPVSSRSSVIPCAAADISLDSRAIASDASHVWGPSGDMHGVQSLEPGAPLDGCTGSAATYRPCHDGFGRGDTVSARDPRCGG